MNETIDTPNPEPVLEPNPDPAPTPAEEPPSIAPAAPTPAEEPAPAASVTLTPAEEAIPIALAAPIPTEERIADAVPAPKSILARIDQGFDFLLTSGLSLFLLALPFHLVIKRLFADPLGTYWKEILLGFLVVIWLIHSIIRRRSLWINTPLNNAVLFYLGLLLLRFILDRSGWVGAWGFYISVMYLPLFWLLPAAFQRHPTRLAYLLAAIIGVGVIVAAGGISEFILNASLWPSLETLERQGFADVYVYGTHLRRVYFVFDSPTTLANTLALLIPLALALAWNAHRAWLRLIGLGAALLITICVILTFSRGIWVAVAIALLAMVFLSNLLRHKRRALLILVGSALMIALAGVALIILRPSSGGEVEQGVIELPTKAYWEAPVSAPFTTLFELQPIYGEAATQTWVLPDPFVLQEDQRVVLYEHPSESGKREIIYRLTLPERAALRFAVALSPEVWSPDKGDGVNLQIFITDPEGGQGGQFVFKRYINPKFNPNDRRWRNFLLDLSPWSGQTIQLSLITESGPAKNLDYDWAGWANLQLVSLPAGYFAANAPAARSQSPAFSHLQSIVDWANDETNRDRLAAWTMALDAWRENPWWGKGLGTTGVAALRAQPASAFVTESQILKALTELGILGLIALGYLWFQIARTGYRAYTTAAEPSQRMLLLGLLISLLIVFIEGWVYQNLEVKQVNAYFWTMVGAAAFLAQKDG